jgi:hypothetical protein
MSPQDRTGYVVLAATHLILVPLGVAMRCWRCGSEDDRREDLKPQYGCNDRHEPEADVDQNCVTARGLRVSGDTAQEHPNNSEQQRGPRVDQSATP